MITIIQQITIKNQFLLRVSKINIFWLDCTQNSIFPFTWFPSQKGKARKRKFWVNFPKVEKLFNFTFLLGCNLCCAWWNENLHIVLYVLHFIYRFAISNTILWKHFSNPTFVQNESEFIYPREKLRYFMCTRFEWEKKRQWSSVVSWKAIIIFISISNIFTLFIYVLLDGVFKFMNLYLRRVNGSFFPYDFNYQ